VITAVIPASDLIGRLILNPSASSRLFVRRRWMRGSSPRMTTT